MDTIFETLEKRGLIQGLTHPKELKERSKRPMNLYIGFDPTASSLHIGSLVGIVILHWFQKYGHKPIVLLGGATARIGDPSGKSVERPLLADKAVKENALSIEKHFKKMLDWKTKETMPLIVNNDDWYKEYSIVNFLRDVGKYFRVGPMLGKESVRSRIDSEEGMSFTEFSYQIFQAYDFFHLSKECGVVLQMGGSDQWGNITAGIDYIHKVSPENTEVFGATFPLLTGSDGKKFGKTEKGAIWLDQNLLSAYQFYQYLFSTSDNDVGMLLRRLTFLSLEEIEEIEKKMKDSPNSAQKKLAEEVTRFVHGEEGLKSAEHVTEALFGKRELDADFFKQIGDSIGSFIIKEEEIIGMKSIDLFAKAEMAESRSASLRLFKNGGLSINNRKIENEEEKVAKKDLIDGKHLLLGVGKKTKKTIFVE